MPVVNILPAFGYSWADLGTVEPITDDQWKVGWSFIGAVPPSVEQFNKWGQIFDLKSNYLYAQLKTIYDLTGVVPSSVDGNTLRDALRGANLFVTAAPGTSDTKAATTAFVAAEVLASPGRLLNTQVFTTSGTYTPTPGTKMIRVRMVGGGGSGFGTPANPSGVVTAGSGGGSGGYAEAIYTSAFAGVAVTIGAGGVGVANGTNVGGASSFGALLTCPGGGGGNIKQVSTSTAVSQSQQGTAGAVPSGSGIVWATAGGWGFPAIVYGTVNEAYGGQGAVSVMGRGAGNTSSSGNPGGGYGAGGSGAAGVNTDPARAGGNGSSGIAIIEEFA